jgi:signal peptidase
MNKRERFDARRLPNFLMSFIISTYHVNIICVKKNHQYSKSESPVVVVLSGSMEPAFQRGDILFLNNSVDRVYVGDVVVFKIRDRDIPIVHRILKVHEKSDGKVELLTKGDNNRVDDRGLYAPGQLWLEREDILGKAVGTLRYVGMVTIALNDYPVLKYVLVGMMGLFVLTSKEG